MGVGIRVKHACSHRHVRVHADIQALWSKTPARSALGHTHWLSFNFLTAEKLVGGSRSSLILIYAFLLVAFSRRWCAWVELRNHVRYDPVSAELAACCWMSGRGSRDLLKWCDLIVSMAFCKVKKEVFQEAFHRYRVSGSHLHLSDVCSARSPRTAQSLRMASPG